MNKGAVGLLAALFLCSACVLNRMEENIQDTNKYVKATNEKMDETKDGQALGLAFDIVGDPTRDRTYRITSAETLIIKGKDERIWKYFGIPSLINEPTALREFRKQTVSFPNVTLVGTKEDWALGINCVGSELYEIISFAAGNLPLQYIKKSLATGQSSDDKRDLKADVKRLIEASTAILGASHLDSIKRTVFFDLLNRERLDEEDAWVKEIRTEGWTKGILPPKRTFLIDVDFRKETAERLETLAVNAGLTEAEIQEMRIFIEVRLGLRWENHRWQALSAEKQLKFKWDETVPKP